MMRFFRKIALLTLLYTALYAAEKTPVEVKTSPVKLQKVKISFTEISGVSRKAHFTALMPFAKSMLYDVSQLRMVDRKNRTVIFDSQVLERYHDKSIALLLLRGFVEVKANMTTELFMEYGSHVLNNFPGEMIYASSGSRMVISAGELTCEMDLEKVKLPENIAIGKKRCGNFAPLFLSGSVPENKWQMGRFDKISGIFQLNTSKESFIRLYFYPEKRIKIERFDPGSTISGISFVSDNDKIPAQSDAEMYGRNITLFDFGKNQTGNKILAAELSDPICGIFSTDYLYSAGQKVMSDSMVSNKDLQTFLKKSLDSAAKKIHLLSPDEALEIFNISNDFKFFKQLLRSVPEVELPDFISRKSVRSEQKAYHAMKNLHRMLQSRRDIPVRELASELENLYINASASQKKEEFYREFVRFSRLLAYGFCEKCGVFYTAVDPAGKPANQQRCPADFNISGALQLMRAADISGSRELASKSLIAMKRVLLDNIDTQKLSHAVSWGSVAKRYLQKNGLKDFEYDESGFLKKCAGNIHGGTNFKIISSADFSAVLTEKSRGANITLIRNGDVYGKIKGEIFDSNGRLINTIFPDTARFEQQISVSGEAGKKFLIRISDNSGGVWRFNNGKDVSLSVIHKGQPVYIKDAQFCTFTLNVPEKVDKFAVKFSGTLLSRSIMLLISPEGKKYIAENYGEFKGLVKAPELTVKNPVKGQYQMILHVSEGDAVIQCDNRDISVDLVQKQDKITSH